MTPDVIGNWDRRADDPRYSHTTSRGLAVYHEQRTLQGISPFNYVNRKSKIKPQLVYLNEYSACMYDSIHFGKTKAYSLHKNLASALKNTSWASWLLEKKGKKVFVSNATLEAIIHKNGGLFLEQ